VRSALAEVAARVDGLARGPSIDSSLFDELRSRLEALEGRSDDEVRAAVADLSARLEGLAQRPVVDPSWVDTLHSRLEALEGRSDDDVRRRVDELMAWQSELDQQAGKAPEGLDELRVRVSQLEKRGDESWRGPMDALQARVESLAARSAVDPMLVDELHSRLRAVEGRSDEELRSLVDALSHRLDEQAQRPAVDPAVIEELWSRLVTVEELGSRIDGIDELHPRLAAVEARSDEELRARLEELHGELSTLRSRPVIEPSVLVDLQRQIEALAGRESPEAHQALETVASLVSRVAALEGRSDEELRHLVETIRQRVDELERRPAADVSLPARLEELAERQRVEASGLADRVGEALGALTAWIDALRAAEGEARGVLADATQRVDDLERRAARIDDVERGLAELRDRPAQNEAAIALWRAVDTLRGRAEQALTLLGELGTRVESLEAAPNEQAQARAEHDWPAPAEPPLSSPPPAAAHVLFVPGGDRYELLERDGAPPVAGELVELPDGIAALLVSRVGRSPLPGDERPCAYLTP
jgi:chromosome segregation ATPase